MDWISGFTPAVFSPGYRRCTTVRLELPQTLLPLLHSLSCCLCLPPHHRFSFCIPFRSLLPFLWVRLFCLFSAELVGYLFRSALCSLSHRLFWDCFSPFLRFYAVAPAVSPPGLPASHRLFCIVSYAAFFFSFISRFSDFSAFRVVTAFWVRRSTF